MSSLEASARAIAAGACGVLALYAVAERGTGLSMPPGVPVYFIFPLLGVLFSLPSVRVSSYFLNGGCAAFAFSVAISLLLATSNGSEIHPVGAGLIVFVPSVLLLLIGMGPVAFLELTLGRSEEERSLPLWRGRNS
jgi:hypothetical protein